MPTKSPVNLDSSGPRGPALWPAVLFIFSLGIVIRIFLLALTPASPVPHNMEPINLAISIIRNGTYADPYSGQSGPSAHCMPLHPLLTAFLIRLFGLGTAGSRALNYAASAAASLGYALLPVLARNCSMRPVTGILAGLFGASLPINFWPQTSGAFEAPYTLLALVVLASILGPHWQGAHFTDAGAIKCGAAAAVCVLCNPSAIPMIGLWFACALLLFPNIRSAVLRYFLIVVAVVFIVLLPWAARNRLVLGSLIFTRSNFGLEFHLANNAIATSDAELNMRNPNWAKLHPNTSDEQRANVRRMGEVWYNRVKLSEAVGWIRANPRRFVRITLERIALFWFPRMLRLPQTLVQWLITVLAVAGLIQLWKTQSRAAAFLGSACLGYSPVYAIIAASPRYRFPIEGFLLLLASYAVWQLSTKQKGTSVDSNPFHLRRVQRTLNVLLFRRWPANHP